MRGNKIGREGVEDLMKCLKKTRNILSLDLRDNPGFTKDFSLKILESLKKNMLFYKKIRENKKKEGKLALPERAKLGNRS